MPRGLVRYQQAHHLHFITFSSHKRQSFLSTPTTRDLFERSLEKTRLRYNFSVTGYVIMPEHVHLMERQPLPS